MMQAIRTRYLGPSDNKGSRIQAKREAKTIYLGYNHGLNSEENHRAAMLALVALMRWNGKHHGVMRDGVFGGDTYWVSVK